jgi:hypothetical protein
MGTPIEEEPDPEPAVLPRFFNAIVTFGFLSPERRVCMPSASCFVKDNTIASSPSNASRLHKFKKLENQICHLGATAVQNPRRLLDRHHCHMIRFLEDSQSIWMMNCPTDFQAFQSAPDVKSSISPLSKSELGSEDECMTSVMV